MAEQLNSAPAEDLVCSQRAMFLGSGNRGLSGVGHFVSALSCEIEQGKWLVVRAMLAQRHGESNRGGGLQMKRLAYPK